MKKPLNYFPLLILLAFTAFASCKKNGGGTDTGAVTGGTITPPPVIVSTNVAYWLTQPDQTVLFKKQNVALNFVTAADNGNTTITVDTTQTYQSIDGFGFALTGSSAYLLNTLPATQQDAILKELFLTDSTKIGISYLRITIGASDLSQADFTYDEVGSGTDLNLQSFDISKERTDLIPILKKIVALNPTIKILACPWTAPTWMKTNNSFSGGSLQPGYYDVYARYFVKYIQAMKAEGITIDAITPQNEPLNAYNNPAMVMQPAEENNFIKNNLGPQFKLAGLTTKIICYDHNTDRTDYPLAILADPVTNPYVDGSAFHLYLGNISALSPVHDAFPNKNIYFTEQATFGGGDFGGDLQWHITNLIIGATRNWSRNVIEWNLASDPSLGPHTSGGCSTCLGAITIGNSNVTRNVSYYIIAHASKFVRPGSVRIASNISNNLQNVAFKTPEGKKVLIVMNTNSSYQTFNIKFNNKMVTTTMPPSSAATYVW
jgi:glucosylceramidase